MADVKWTDAQLDAINAEGENILVSAAAGSGKTAVLVERVIRMITREENPLDIDRLVVMTFTRAAARQMKNKIYKALKSRINSDPDNSYLRRQLMKIPNARICTIDSLCNVIVRENFHAVDLDPAFRIADEAEISMLKKDVLQKVIEREYQKADSRFMDFVEYYTDKNDTKLESIILTLHKYADSYPEPENWLRACVLPYISAGRLFEFDIEYPEGMENWMGRFKDIVDIKQNEIRQMAVKGLAISNMNQGPEKYVDLFQDIIDTIDKITDQPLDFRSPEIIQFLENWKKAPVISKKDDVDEELKEQASKLRAGIKKKLTELRDNFLYADMDHLCGELDACCPIAKTISEVTLKFTEEFKKEKKERLIADFSDIAHYALKVLIDYDEEGRIIRENGKPVYTETADVMAAGIDEIIVDEYQDTNNLQEELVRAISGERFGRPNVFMVGDVKQSIYGFRMACPELFIDKMDDYLAAEAGREPEKGQKGRLIVLDRNFRSRREVLDFTNLIFRQTMVRDVGGIDYLNDKHDLVYGGLYGDKTVTDPEYIPEVKFIHSSGEESKYQEAYLIAERIEKLTASGKYSFSDIAILTRSADNPQLEQVLRQRGIPVIKSSGKGFFDSFEISLTLNLLSIIDNPFQDIPFAAVLYSPVCGADANDLAQIKIAGYSGSSLYECLRSMVKKSKENKEYCKFEVFLDKLESWRRQATYTGLYDFVEHVLNDSGLYNITSAMPEGAGRRANLELLKSKIHSFTKGSYIGLFNFIRYIKELRDNDIDFGTVNAVSAGAEAVQMMTIHKSKGLEFPVVFIASAGKKYNESDINASIIPDKSIGIGIELRNTETRIIRKTALMQTIRYKQKTDTYAEEMRLLYVAMTRAKEKLIITGTHNSLESFAAQWASEPPAVKRGRTAGIETDEADIRYEAIQQYRIMECGCFLRLIGMAVYALRESSCLFNLEYLEDTDIEETRAGELIENALTAESLYKLIDEKADTSELTEMFGMVYPYLKATLIQGKITASQLENRDYSDANKTYKVKAKSIYSKDGELTGAERGNAYHRIFELLDYSRAHSSEEIELQLSQLHSKGRLSKEEVNTIEVSKLTEFIGSDLGKRMAAASASGRLFREKQFVMGYYEDINSQETVTGPELEKLPESKTEDKELLLVQGIIDAFFTETDENGEEIIILVDYKTDKNADEEHYINTYRPQLNAYKDAIERSTGKRVAGQIIYSIELGREIVIA